MTRGELVWLEAGKQWEECRVLVGWHEGAAGVLFVARRLCDGQRLLVDVEGRMVEVPG